MGFRESTGTQSVKKERHGESRNVQCAVMHDAVKLGVCRLGSICGGFVENRDEDPVPTVWSAVDGIHGGERFVLEEMLLHFHPRPC